MLISSLHETKGCLDITFHKSSWGNEIAIAIPSHTLVYTIVLGLLGGKRDMLPRIYVDVCMAIYG